MTLGIKFDQYFKKVCCSDSNVKKMLEIGVVSFKNFVRNNMSDIAAYDWIENQLTEFTNLLVNKDKYGPKEVVTFLCRHESFILTVINAILKNLNLKFFRYITPFLDSYQRFLQVDEAHIKKIKYESFEVYRKIYINPNLINTFIKTFEKEKYYFFPGVSALHSDHKRDQRQEASQRDCGEHAAEHPHRTGLPLQIQNPLQPPTKRQSNLRLTRHQSSSAATN